MRRFHPYKFLKVPKICSTYALTATPKVYRKTQQDPNRAGKKKSTPARLSNTNNGVARARSQHPHGRYQNGKVSVTIRDRAFTDCDFDSGQIIFDDALKDGKKLKELAPRPPPKKELPRALPSPELAPIPPLRYAAPPKEKTTVNYAHLRTKQENTRSKLQLARGGQGPLLRTDQWQSGFLERLAQKNAVTLHDGKAKQEATQYAKEVGRAIAYWSTGSKAWRFGRVRGLLNDADREEEMRRLFLRSGMAVIVEERCRGARTAVR